MTTLKVSKRRGVRVAVAAAAFVGVAVMSGCSALGEFGSPAPETSSAQVVTVAQSAAGFQSSGAWSVKGVVDAPGSAVLSGGNAVAVKKGADGGFVLTGVSDDSAGNTWESAGDVFDGNGAPPRLYSVQQQGRPFVVATQKSADGELVAAWDGYATQRGAKPTAKVQVKGSSATVRISPYGVLVDGDGASPKTYVLNLDSGKKSTYVPGASLQGEQGKPVALGSSNTVVIDYGVKGFSVATLNGPYAWDSTKASTRPAGVDGKGKVSLLGTDGHYIVASWQGPNGFLVSVQDVVSGQVLMSVPIGEDVKADLGSPVVTSVDGRYVVWSGHVFDLVSRAQKAVAALKDVRPVFAARGWVYGVDGRGHGVSVSSVGKGVADQPVPVGFSGMGLGVFLAKSQMYALPME